jgi:ABC-type sugar transport system ATPase subunit
VATLLDESTAHLSDEELAKLADLIDKARREGR